MRDADFDVRIFSVLPPRVDGDIPPDIPRDWEFPTYIAIQPNATDKRKTNQVKWLLPNWPKFSTLFLWFVDQFQLIPKWLKCVLLTWKPTIVHSFPLNTGGKPVANALSTLSKRRWPHWVVTSWGSDLFIGLKGDSTKNFLEFVINNCDGFFSDCQRDQNLAIETGLQPDRLALPYAVPGSGGLDLDYFSNLREIHSLRDVILIPKGFERVHANRAFTIIEALGLVRDLLKSYQIHLLTCSKSAQIYLRQMPEEVQKRCHVHEMLPQQAVFSLLSRSRVVVAPSLSDGTPNIMLEAMAAGALPIMSPIEPHQEWIIDGKNGLLAHALFPDKIASALKRALTDDTLFERASKLNWDIVQQRADRQKVREDVLTYYRKLSQNPK